MARPLIALPAYPVSAGRVEGWRDPAIAVPEPYVSALARAGGQEMVVAPAPITESEAFELVDRCDGLLLVGGPDLDPATYGQPAHQRVYGVSAVRDAFELALCRAALARTLPLLAICRGMQLLNVASGGTLRQHISDDFPGHGKPGVEGGQEVHVIPIEPGSRLSGALDVPDAACSCHHHQAVDALGAGLRVTARSPDQIVEAIEPHGDAWVVGVQWHPEDTAGHDAVQQRLFDTFVSRCGRT